MGIQGSRAENSVVLLRSGVFVVLVIECVEFLMGAGEGGFLLLM